MVNVIVIKILLVLDVNWTVVNMVTMVIIVLSVAASVMMVGLVFTAI